MAPDRSTARRARKQPLRRPLVVLMATGALITAFGFIGSQLIGGHDDSVTLVPTQNPSPTPPANVTPPGAGDPSGVPTAASTSGPSPTPTTPDPEPSEDRTSAPDRSGPGDDASPPPESRATIPAEPTDQPEPGPSASVTPSPEADPACTARAEVVDEALIRFTATVTITNDSATTLVDWTSTFTLPGHYELIDAEGVEPIETGKHAKVRGTGASAVIGAGASLTFEITARGISGAERPSHIAVDGVVCD